MTTPTLEGGPYFFDVNNYYYESSGSNAIKRGMLELKNALIGFDDDGAIWSVVSSSDGTSYSSSGDLWSTVADIVHNSDGSNHSWIVLVNNTTGGELCLDSNDTSAVQWTVIYSANGFNTDGSVTNRPTATEFNYIASTTYDVWSTSSNYRKIVINVMISDDHKTTRWYFHGRDSVDGRKGGWFGGIEHVANTPAAWTSTYPTALTYYQGSFAVSATGWEMTPRLSIFDTATLRCFIETAAPYSGWQSAYPTCECYGETGTTAQADPIMHNNVDQDLLGGYPVCPIGVFRPGGDQGGNIGRLRDIFFSQRTHGTLDTYPADASRTWIKWGCLLVPWSGDVPRDAV